MCKPVAFVIVTIIVQSQGARKGHTPNVLVEMKIYEKRGGVRDCPEYYNYSHLLQKRFHRAL